MIFEDCDGDFTPVYFQCLREIEILEVYRPLTGRAMVTDDYISNPPLTKQEYIKYLKDMANTIKFDLIEGKKSYEKECLNEKNNSILDKIINIFFDGGEEIKTKYTIDFFFDLFEKAYQLFLKVIKSAEKLEWGAPIRKLKRSMAYKNYDKATYDYCVFITDYYDMKTLEFCPLAKPRSKYTSEAKFVLSKIK